MTDDPEEEEEDVPPPVPGRVDPETVDEHVHPAGWIVLPDSGSQTGWVDHEVPRAPARARKRVGFHRDEG